MEPACRQAGRQLTIYQARCVQFLVRNNRMKIKVYAFCLQENNKIVHYEK